MSDNQTSENRKTPQTKCFECPSFGVRLRDLCLEIQTNYASLGHINLKQSSLASPNIWFLDVRLLDRCLELGQTKSVRKPNVFGFRTLTALTIWQLKKLTTWWLQYFYHFKSYILVDKASRRTMKSIYFHLSSLGVIATQIEKKNRNNVLQQNVKQNENAKGKDQGTEIRCWLICFIFSTFPWPLWCLRLSFYQRVTFKNL